MDLDDLKTAQNAVISLTVSLSPEDWELPTPCEQWDAAAVMRHLMVGERAHADALRGAEYDLAALDAVAQTVDLEDLPRAYEIGARGLRDALEDADSSATFPTGIGPMPPVAIATLRTIEALVHGWDLARAFGFPLPADDAVAERAYANSVALLERVPADRRPFAPSVPVADDASALHRLVALLGRDPLDSRSRDHRP